MTPTNQCPIWPGFKATIASPSIGAPWIVESPHAGGKYEVDDDLAKDLLSKDLVVEFDYRVRARLTTWLVDQRRLGSQCPKITPEIVEYVKAKQALPPHERAIKLLRFTSEQMTTIATPTLIHHEYWEAYAWSESADWNELRFLIEYLNDEKLLDAKEDPVRRGFRCRVTMNGYRLIAEQEAHVATTQAFVAMWFDNSMDDAFERGIKPAIEVAGYKPLRIDQKPDANKLDDEIIAEIRRSRFLVADFTHGAEGARGGVYFEAGFAEGLGIPVIYTCRKNMMDKLHFDTRQYAHIVWETPDELRGGLLNRILARIGEGPGDNVVL